MMMPDADLAEVIQRDPRYAYEAYQFVYEALQHTQKMLGRASRQVPKGEERAQHHVSGPELLDGIRDLALKEFGLMARTVFRLWGIQSTDDFGEIVFNLIEAKKMDKTSEDSRDDFHDVYDLDEALVKGYQIQLEETE